MTEELTKEQIAYQKKLINNARYYRNRFNTDEEFKKAEKERIKEGKKNRYNNDPDYRKKIQEQNRQNYHNKKSAQKNFC